MEAFALAAVEDFIDTHELDDGAANLLREQGPEVQLEVMNTNWKVVRNKSATVTARVRKAKAKAGSVQKPLPEPVSQKSEPAFEPDPIVAAAVEEFIVAHMLNTVVAERLREQNPEVQLEVMNMNWQFVRDVSATVKARIEKARAQPGSCIQDSQVGKVGSSQAGISINSEKPFEPNTLVLAAVEEFVRTHRLDHFAAKRLREEPSQVQLEVMNMNWKFVQDVSNTVIARIERAKAQPGSDQMPVSATTGAPLPELVPVQRDPAVEYAVQTFISENDLDKTAIEALLKVNDDVQQFVLGLGGLAGARNKSSAVLGRIHKARQLGLDKATRKPQMKIMVLPGLEDFILDNHIDAHAAQELRMEDLVVQQAILDAGPLRNARNVSSAVLGRIKKIKEDIANNPLTAHQVQQAAAHLRQQIEEQQMAEEVTRQVMLEHQFLEEQRAQLAAQAMAAHQQAADQAAAEEMAARQRALEEEEAQRNNAMAAQQNLATAVQQFIIKYDLDEQASRCLTHENPEVQQHVIMMPGMDKFGNKSSALMMRVKATKDRLGLGPGQVDIGEVTLQHVQQFIYQNQIDEKASQNLLSESKEIQKEVIEMGSLLNTSNPNAALMGRVGKIKKKLGYGPALGSSHSAQRRSDVNLRSSPY